MYDDMQVEEDYYLDIVSDDILFDVINSDIKGLNLTVVDLRRWVY